MKKIKVLIIDDSALVRTLLTSIFEASGEIEVVGTAADPIIARSKIKKFHPDVLTLDIEMPRMDGLTFLRNLMRLRPMPVIMVSSLTEQGAKITLESLAIGAVDFVAKPKSDLRNGLLEYGEDLIEKIKVAAQIDFTHSAASNESAEMINDEQSPHALKVAQVNVPKNFKRTEKIIAIGASTGGTEAIKNLVRDLPKTTPAIIITQHLPIAFTESFVKHVDEVTEMNVYTAINGQKIEAGCIYIAPGNRHLMIEYRNNHYYCKLYDGDLVNRHKPSVEVMFHSVAKHVGGNAIGIMLTGMGGDGGKAMKLMRDYGAINIVQNEESSVVWGMPRVAYEAGAAHYIEPLNKIASRICYLSFSRKTPSFMAGM